MWIDRRVDPRREITLVASKQPMATLLDQVAQQAELGVVAFDRVVYVGPLETAAELHKTSSESAKASRRLSRRGTTNWQRLATPRQIAIDVANEVGVTITNLERIPHDVWPAGATPAMAAGDRLTLLLAGFDLRWRATSNARRIEIASISASKDAATPPALATLIDSERAESAQETRYTLRIVDKPLGAVLRQLAAQLGKPIAIAPELGQLDTRVSVEVNQVTIEELLTAVGKAGSVNVAMDNEITIQPRR
ncbi:MAG: hypothetical protein AAF266_08115 [Planctomycetota bacterium]